MALNRALIGREYPAPEVYEVGREHVRSFARAIGDPSPACVDPAAARALGHADVVAPPTFPIVVTMAANGQIMRDPGLGMDYTRVVHGDQKFSYVRPVVAGDTLVCVSTVEEITQRGGHDFITTRADVTTQDGEPLLTAWMKLVQRGEEKS